MSDALFAVSNSFHVGAYQAAINAAADLTGLSDKDASERDAFTYRAYLALGSHLARPARGRTARCGARRRGAARAGAARAADAATRAGRGP